MLEILSNGVSLVIYIDGMHFGEQCVLAAVGVDSQGRKHVMSTSWGRLARSLPLDPEPPLRDDRK